MTSTGATQSRGAIFEPRALLKRLQAFASLDTNVVLVFFVLTNVVRTLSSVILTRLLMPEVFGIAGMIGSIQFTVAMVSDLGFQAFVVRHADGDKPRFLDTIWTISLARSFGLALILITLADPISGLFDKPELAVMIAVSALTFVIDGLASLTLLTSLRNRQVLRLSVLEFITMVVQIAVTAVLAYYWRSYWAILAGMLASSSLKTILSYALFRNSLRKLALDFQYARELWLFARFITGSSIIFLLLAQTDKLVLARLMSLESFGLYILSSNLAMAPLAFASAYASRVLYPTYSQLWRDGCSDLRKQFYAKRWLPSLLYTFMAGGVIGSAPLIVTILYDPRYAGAALYLQVLGIGTMFAMASNSSNEALTSTGRVRATFEANIAKLVWMAAAAPAGYWFYGELGLVAAVALMEVPAIGLKWVQMRRADLLDLRQELLFLGAGVVGIATGTVGDLVVRPFVH